MKILLMSNMYPSKQKPYSGIFVLNQYNYLKEEYDFEIELFAMKRTFTSKLGSIIKYFKAAVTFIPRVFKRYEVIHLHFFYPLILLAWFYKLLHPKTRLIVTFHGSDITKYFNNESNRRIFKFFLKKVDIVISVGKDLGDLIKEKLNRNYDYILSAGVDERMFYSIPSINKKFDFIFVGSFIERKGVDILIQAIKILNNKQISFCFVGSGEFLNRIKELKENYNVHLFENQTQDQLRVLYNESKYFILPSRDEPFGLVATEALFCGTPILVSSNGGLKDQVNEGNGFVVNSDEPNFYVEQIKKLIQNGEDDYKVLRTSALKSNKQHSLKIVCDSLVNIYSKL